MSSQTEHLDTNEQEVKDRKDKKSKKEKKDKDDKKKVKKEHRKSEGKGDAPPAKRRKGRSPSPLPWACASWFTSTLSAMAQIEEALAIKKELQQRTGVEQTGRP